MGCLSNVLPAVGTAVGSFFGGPIGGALGNAAGSALSGGGGGSKNAAGGPSGGGGVIGDVFGTPPQIYSRNPEWVNKASQENYDRALTASNQPYQAYTGQQVAPLTANQQQGINRASTALGQFDKTYGNITDYWNQSAQPNTATYTPTAVGYDNVNSTANKQSISMPSTWNAEAAQQYMNPYLQASLDPQIRNLNDQYAQQQNIANSKAAGSGNFGGSRQGVMNAIVNQRQNQDIQDVTARGYNTAYDTALGAFQNAQNQNLAAQSKQADIYGQDNEANLRAQLANQAAGINTGQFNETARSGAFKTNQDIAQQNRLAQQAAAQGLTGLTAQQQSNQNAMINNLMSTGGVAQSTNQAQNTADYQNYMNKMYYPQQQASYLQGLLGTSPNAGSLSAGQGVIGNNGVGNLVGQLTNGQNGGVLGGIGSAIGGMFGLGNTNTAQPWVNPDTGAYMM